MKPLKNNFKKGFTLIELLVVISIIGILAALAFVSFTTSQRQARDTQRKSDIKQYSTALEEFANANSGLYPSRTTNTAASGTLCTTDLSISTCSEDPKSASDSTFTYYYQSDGSGGGAKDASTYVLWAKLENSANYWVVCSDGKVGLIPTSNFGVSGGSCPL